ncbi:hypothetical protein [Kribbella sp. NPDC048915]|uniref:hypothetical protein n=1 Tax=Kribbella sp. NPDC048915 TaxID=3155148 RepID=UPI0033CAB61B
MLSEPFTTGSEDVDTAVDRLQDHARRRDWDLVVGLTELPLHDHDGQHVLVKTDPGEQIAVLSLPALGGLRMHARARRAVRSLISRMANPSRNDKRFVALPCRGGHWRLLVGMVLANRPWLLVPGLKSALVAALATGAVATINSTVWLVAGTMSWWRLVVATVASIALAIGGVRVVLVARDETRGRVGHGLVGVRKPQTRSPRLHRQGMRRWALKVGSDAVAITLRRLVASHRVDTSTRSEG